jgi:hypothetical protein
MLFALLALAGCGPRAGGGDVARAAGASDVVVDLPAIYVDFNADGVGTIGGMSVSQAGQFIGQSLPDLSLGADAVAALEQYNIQHIQLINTEKGLDILVNGMRVPSLGWNAEVLANLQEQLNLLGTDLGGIGNLLPLAGNFNTGIVLRFPRAADREPLPLVDPMAAEIAQRTQQATQAFAAGVGDLPTIKFSVDYNPDGTWTVQGKDTAAWEETLPIGWDGFDLPPELVQGAAAAGLQTLGIATNEEGINFSLNGKALPTITWGSGEMSNLIQLLKNAGVMDELTGGSAQVEGILDLAEQLLPTIQAADFGMTVNFPQ